MQIQAHDLVINKRSNNRELYSSVCRLFRLYVSSKHWHTFYSKHCITSQWRALIIPQLPFIYTPAQCTKSDLMQSVNATNPLQPKNTSDKFHSICKPISAIMSQAVTTEFPWDAERDFLHLSPGLTYINSAKLATVRHRIKCFVPWKYF